MSFSDDMEKLQDITDRFESEDLGMDESLTLFEEGVKLVKDCRAYLESARRRVTIIMDDKEVESGIADG